MNITTRLLCAALALSLAACSTTSGQPATESRSGFTGARIVSVSTHGLQCENACLGLGAQWSSDRPAIAVLEVSVLMQYANISGAALNIDGRVVQLVTSPTASTGFASPAGMRTSTRAFAADMADVRAILGAKRVWLRVQTPQGSIEDAVISDGKDSKAFNALARFVAQVGSAG